MPSLEQRVNKLENDVRAASEEPENSPAGRRVLRAFTTIDDHLKRQDDRIDNVVTRLDKIEGRINYLFGALGVLVVVANLAVPFVQMLFK